MKLKPATPGMRIRDPLTKRHIPDAGIEVPMSTYWVRRIRAGEVVEVKPDVIHVDQIPDSNTNEG